MIKKSLNSKMQLFSCAITLLIAGIMSPLFIGAYTITSFPPSSFNVVDRTTPFYTNAWWYPPLDTVVGYMPYVDNEPNRYQLTDTVPQMTVAMWWTGVKLDVNKDFMFCFNLFFDTGMAQPNVPRNIADGICWVAHTIDDVSSLIGNTSWFIGYGYTSGTDVGGSGMPPPLFYQGKDSIGVLNIGNSIIAPSFAVEWDTEFGSYNRVTFALNEGGDVIAPHIAYLRDGNMTALPGTYKQMQNGWGSPYGWYTCSIHWRIGKNSNGTSHYDIFTYMQEGPTGPMVLRNRAF